MAQNFSASVADWVRESKAAMGVVRNEAAQRVIAVMQEPGGSMATTKKAIEVGFGTGRGGGNSRKRFGPIANPGGSGNMPVDTGFLRASLVVGIGTVNTPTTSPPADGGAFSWDEAGANLVIEGADLQSPIEARYTAVYARVAEYGGPNRVARRFVALAAQQWPRIVADVVSEVGSRSGA